MVTGFSTEVQEKLKFYTTINNKIQKLKNN